MNKILTTIIGCLSIFVATTIGASIVFFISKKINNKLSLIINGFSAGIMVSASIFGLIIPSLNYSDKLYPTILGAVIGIIFLQIIDLIIFIINKKQNLNNDRKLIRFVGAFTIHNIPEGMAVGFAFGNALLVNSSQAFLSALVLALGIAIQNIPEGMAVSLPVYKQTEKKGKSFLVGMLSGIVEPIFAVFGLFLASKVEILLPWLLSFSAGTMLFVSIDDLIPESSDSNSHLGSYAFVVGFFIMMLLDIFL